MLDMKVSIHAPAWGATIPQLNLKVKSLVSIHAPAWGATRKAARDATDEERFNPRARMGRDHILFFVGQNPNLVSIHAPAWGAT